MVCTRGPLSLQLQGKVTLPRPFFQHQQGACPSSTRILALLAYLAAASGFPLPAIATKDQSQPYPCMDHPCGCLSAEQCWRHCCCFTPAQKLAWAETHGILPPPYAEPARTMEERLPLCEQGEHADQSPAACSKCGRKTPHE